MSARDRLVRAVDAEDLQLARTCEAIEADWRAGRITAARKAELTGRARRRRDAAARRVRSLYECERAAR